MMQAANAVHGDPILYYELCEISNRIHGEQLSETQRRALHEHPPTSSGMKRELFPECDTTLVSVLWDEVVRFLFEHPGQIARSQSSSVEFMVDRSKLYSRSASSSWHDSSIPWDQLRLSKWWIPKLDQPEAQYSETAADKPPDAHDSLATETGNKHQITYEQAKAAHARGVEVYTDSSDGSWFAIVKPPAEHCDSWTYALDRTPGRALTYDEACVHNDFGLNVELFGSNEEWLIAAPPSAHRAPGASYRVPLVEPMKESLAEPLPCPQNFLCALSEMVRDPEQIWIFDFDARLYRWDPTQCLLLRLEGEWKECRTEFNILMSSTWSCHKEENS
jgi:hypothetical protein